MERSAGREIAIDGKTGSWREMGGPVYIFDRKLFKKKTFKRPYAAVSKVLQNAPQRRK